MPGVLLGLEGCCMKRPSWQPVPSLGAADTVLTGSGTFLQATQLYKMRSRNKQQVLFPCGGNGNTFMPCQAHKSQPLCPEVQACPTLPAGNSVWASLYTEPGIDLDQVLQEAAAITN